MISHGSYPFQWLKDIKNVGGDYDGKTTYIMEDFKETMIGRRK